MIRSILTVSAGTFASRLLGFLRDAMIAALLGAGLVADAFLAAFQMITVVRRLLGEGALNAALAPAYLGIEAAHGPRAAAAFAGRVLGTLSLIVLGVALLGFAAMPVIVTLVAPGFAGTSALQTCIDVARLMLPYVALAGPVTVMLALLNAQRRYALTALSPALFNLALIAVMAALMLMPRSADAMATVLAATVGFAGLLQLAILSGGARHLATPLRAGFDAPIRALLAKGGPGMIASAGPQLLVVAGAIVASASPSAVAWLYFASRLVDLPLGLAGAAMNTVLIPELSRAPRSDDAGARIDAQSRALEMALGLALPACFGLMIMATPIVRALFEHGAFTAADTEATASALVMLALALPAQIAVKALSPAFFARGDVTTPLLATLAGIAAALAGCLARAPESGVAGIAAALAFGGWSTAAILIGRGVVTFGPGIDATARRRLPRILVAAGAMAAALWLCETMTVDVLASTHGVARIAMLVLIIAAAVALYGAALAGLGVVRPRDLRAQWLRGKRRRDPSRR